VSWTLGGPMDGTSEFRLVASLELFGELVSDRVTKVVGV